MKKQIVAIISGLVFFMLALITLPHYGINWDAINHLPRGQAYLNYIFTGRKDYSNLPPWQEYWQDPDSLGVKTDIPRKEVNGRSMYQSYIMEFDWVIQQDGAGHPPFSDIVSSAFNRILFGELKLVNDIDSYRIYGILLAALTVFLISWWSTEVYGWMNGLFSALALSLYPLFWAESHFNTEKDIPGAFYYSFFLFSLWKGITKRNIRWILISGLVFGFALGTKFNILFVFPVILIWFLFYYGKQIFDKKISLKKIVKQNKFVVLSLLLIPVIGISVFILAWPYLWPDIIGGIKTVIGFYRSIGTSVPANYMLFNLIQINHYAPKWIILTTPPALLIFSVIGSLVAIYKVIKKKDDLALLFLLWFTVPIVRVSFPKASIYGGVRQIIEFLPGMALMVGFGAVLVVNTLKKVFSLRKIALFLVLLPFALSLLTLIEIHPNENVYFNIFYGGLAGAKRKNIDSWGNSFGSVYRQAASWLNKNAEKNSKVVLVHELMPNLPSMWMRPDIDFYNLHRSGYLRQGEYALTQIFEGSQNRSYYDSYLELFLEPVYDVKVDGVSILKIWKNDDEHLKEDLVEKQDTRYKLIKTENGLKIDLGEVRRLSRLEIDYFENNCSDLEVGLISLSVDGKVWERVPGILPNDWRVAVLREQPFNGHFIEPFVGEKSRYVELALQPPDTCLKQVKNLRIFYFE